MALIGGTTNAHCRQEPRRRSEPRARVPGVAEKRGIQRHSDPQRAVAYLQKAFACDGNANPSLALPFDSARHRLDRPPVR